MTGSQSKQLKIQGINPKEPPIVIDLSKNASQKSKQTEGANPQNAPQKPTITGTPVDENGKTSEEAKVNELETAKKNKDKENKTWWDRNKDWMWPLIIAIVGGALTAILVKMIGAKDTSALQTVYNNIDFNKNTSNDSNNDTTKDSTTSNTSSSNASAGLAAASAGQPTPEKQNEGTQQVAKTTSPTKNSGR